MARAIFLLTVLVTLYCTSQAFPQLDDKLNKPDTYFIRGIGNMVGGVFDTVSDTLKIVDGVIEGLIKGFDNAANHMKGKTNKPEVVSLIDNTKNNMIDIKNKIKEMIESIKQGQ